MTHLLSGAFTVEIDTTRLADEIADRVLTRLHLAAQQAGAHSDPQDDNTTPAGSADYQRSEPDANPPADSVPGGYPLGRSVRERGQEDR